MRRAFGLLEWLVDPDRREEIVGDLLELRGTRSPSRFWWDVLTVALRAPRTREAGRVAVLAALLALLSLGSPAPATGRRTVKAIDPAGTFTLAFEGSRVVAVTMDGAPVSPDRIMQGDGRLVIRGAAGAQNLDIELHPDGSIHWQAREARAARPSSPQ